MNQRPRVKHDYDRYNGHVNIATGKNDPYQGHVHCGWCGQAIYDDQETPHSCITRYVQNHPFFNMGVGEPE